MEHGRIVFVFGMGPLSTGLAHRPGRGTLEEWVELAAQKVTTLGMMVRQWGTMCTHGQAVPLPLGQVRIASPTALLWCTQPLRRMHWETFALFGRFITRQYRTLSVISPPWCFHLALRTVCARKGQGVTSCMHGSSVACCRCDLVLFMHFAFQPTMYSTGAGPPWVSLPR